jgi:hypothetical protein
MENNTMVIAPAECSCTLYYVDILCEYSTFEFFEVA